MLERLCGNEALKENLSAALAAGRLPTAFCSAAPGGWAKILPRGCWRQITSIPRAGPGAEAVLADRSPECLVVRAEGAADIIPVARVREVRAAVRATGLSAEGRVALIEDAQKMQAAAANALLKVLEEPPTGVLFLLTTDSEAAILPTIRSRCAAYTLAPLERQDCVRLLCARGCPAEDAAFLSAVYGGALGRCLAAAGDPQRFALLQTAAEFVSLSARGDRFGLLAAAKEFETKARREEAGIFLSDLAELYAAALERPGDPRPAAVSPAGRRARAAGRF